MFVKIRCETNYCGEWDESVREFPDDTTDEELNDYASDAADDNARSFGELGEPEDEDYREAYGNWEKLEKTREEILEEYGEILLP